MTASPYSPVRARAGTAVNSAGTSVTVNYPSSVESGDLLLVLLCSDTTQTFTATGWTQLGSTLQAQTESSAVFYKTAAGTEGGGTFTVGQTTSARDFKAVCWAIAGGGTPEMGTPANGASGAPDPPSVTHSSGDGDYLMIVGVVADLNRTIVTWPHGLADWFVPPTDIGSIQLNTASGMFESATYDPAALVMEASDGWHTYTIAVPISGISRTGWPVPEGSPAVTNWEVDTTAQTINLPSGIAAGELLIAEVSNSKPTAGGFSCMTVSISGWTEIGTAENFSISGRIRGTILAKVATGSEGTTATLAIESPGDSGTCVVRRFSGADFDKLEAAFSNGSSATATIPSLTPASGSDKVIWLTGFAMDQSTGLPEVWDANGRYGLGGVWARTATNTEDFSSVYAAYEGVEQAALSTFNVTLDQSRRFVGYTVSIYPGVDVTGALDATLADITADFTGGVRPPAVGTIDATLDPVTAEFTGSIKPPVVGVLAATLEPFATFAGEIIPGFQGAVGVDTRPFVYWHLWRTDDGNLALVESHRRLRQGGFAGERVTDRFRTNLFVPRQYIDAATRAAWVANSGESVANLQTALHAALAAASIKRADGTALS